VFNCIVESKKALKNRMIGVKEREVTFGKPSSFASFGWDVDYGTISVRYRLCSFNQLFRILIIRSIKVAVA